MKSCTCCDSTKPLADFSVNVTCKDGLASWCRACVSEYSKVYCMDFDHVRGVKRRPLSRMLDYSVQAIMDEISKCDLVCANCHRVRTEKRITKTDGVISKRLKRYASRKAAINAIKCDPCLDCSLTVPAVALDFDHVRGVKVASVAVMNETKWEKVLAEIQKCDLVCAVCHRKRTEARRVRKPVTTRVRVEKPWARLVGTMADSDLARLYGLSRAVVRNHRKRTGIPVFRPVQEWLPLLGTMPDTDIARMFNKQPEVIRRKRIALGITVFIRQPKWPLKGVTIDRPWHKLAGTMLDREVSRIAGVSKAAVHWYRGRVGIPAFIYRSG